MIIQVNTKGIAIDMNGNSLLIAKYGYELVTVFETDLARFYKYNEDGIDVVKFVDLERNEYCVLNSDITTINGLTTGFSNCAELWQTLNTAMLGI